MLIWSNKEEELIVLAATAVARGSIGFGHRGNFYQRSWKKTQTWFSSMGNMVLHPSKLPLARFWYTLHSCKLWGLDAQLKLHSVKLAWVYFSNFHFVLEVISDCKPAGGIISLDWLTIDFGPDTQLQISLSVKLVSLSDRELAKHHSRFASHL